MSSDIGKIDAVCPYCGQRLQKKPSKKTKCPHCSNFIYVRTRPNDRLRVLVTEAEITQIEAQWDLLRETPSLGYFRERYEGEKEAFERERTILTTKFGRLPSDHDVWWSLLNKKLGEYSRKREWGFYCMTRCDMAKLFYIEGRLQAALETYLEVWYLELNGPRNVGEITNSLILQDYPPFIPEQESYTPSMFLIIISIVQEIGINRDSTHALFFKQAWKHCRTIGLPLQPEEAWPRMESRLFDR